MIKIIDTSSGAFPEVDQLNPSFAPKSLRLKLTVDATAPREHYLDQFPELLFHLTSLFPNLCHHQCSSGNEMDDFRDVVIDNPLLPIKLVGDVIDSVHLLEHVIIELQCSLAQMPRCSGITCNLWEPENRYDVYVECETREMGAFAGRLGVQIINDILQSGAMSTSPRRMVKMVPLLLQQPRTDKRRLAEALRWSATTVQRTLNELQVYQFPFPPSPAVPYSSTA